MTALNFPDSPSNGDTYQGYTYNSTKSAWAKPAEQDARTAVYANIAALPTSGTAGDMAYVTATNRLYIWTGTGWYNIALINNNPTISGVNATYDLAIDGTATTVTITATDPEGLPITYSIASDTSGNTATVVQGTGANTNVFTITPSTSEANAGTFSLTFRASDGVNIASAAASFTLQFKVQNSRYTTALITSVGANNGTNSSFDDKSTSDHTITANGGAHQSTFSPYRSGGYSTYFDGSGDYLKVTDSAEHDFGTGDFSMEFWWWPVSLTGGTGSLHIMISAPNNSHNQLIYHESTYWYFRMGSSTVYQLNSSGSGAATANQWNHVVLCRSGNTMSIFHNGTRTATDASAGSQSIDFSHASIGRYDNGGYEVDGYVRDMRWLKGSSAYDATQTSITVPTEPLTAVTNTTLLTCHLPYIADGSTTGHSIAVNGNTSTKPFVPYDSQEYSASSHLGSAFFDGSGDYLSVPDSDDWHIGASDFTIEGWIYKANDGSHQSLLSNRASGSNEWRVLLDYVTSYSEGAFRLDWGSSYNTWSNANIQADTWTHFAVTRSGTTGTLYINGVSKGDKTLSDIGNISGSLVVGSNDGSGEYYKGNVADLRIVKGTVVYTSNFTPPTAPLTAITNTVFLLQSTDASIIDKAQNARKTLLVGNTKSSTTQTKFLSSSMYFDGTGDYINAENFDIGNVGTAPFTFEGWFYLTASPANYITIMQTRGSNASQTGFVMAISASDFYIYSGALIGQKGSAISSNQWYHWAYTRDTSGNQRVFLDGTQTGSTYTTARNYTDDKLWIGAKYDGSEYFTGYQSDIRITKGLARYTANFTPPTAALKG